ncbi:MAG TPA: VanW family protein [Acidimicrobiia bacterium]
MPPRQRRQTQQNIPLLSVLGLLALVGLVYGLVRWTSQGRVLGSVTVLDVELGGSTPEEATALLVELEQQLAAETIPVEVLGQSAAIIPAEAGFDLDEASIVERAMAVGRTDNPLTNFFWWIGHIGRTTELGPEGSLDPDALEAVLDALDTAIVGEPPFPGSIEVVDGALVAQPPRAGRRIDRDEALELLTTASLTLEKTEVELPVRDEQPAFTEADIEAARDDAEFMLSAPIVLTAENGTELTFTVEDLQQAFVAEIHEDPPSIELGFDPEVIEAKLEPIRSDFESEPENARFEINGYDVEIVPGRSGTKLDAEETAAVLDQASRTARRRAELPLREGAQPEVTTEDLEALDIRHLVSQFTTYYDCCSPRVTNIHLIADEVDGAIVRPGETFSLNQYVGERTEAEGYLPDGTIVRGEIVDTVGGGVSQFATTFYNAVFWGGYEDVEHKPHSFYFDRYPEGIEATISWPSPDLKFRNDSGSGILIKTSYTDTSVTVSFYGNNDGRILVGEQSGGSLRVGVVREGGPNARQVRGDRSDRFDFQEPPDPLYRGNPDLGIDESRQVQGSREGWSVRVTRTITVGGETVTQEWVVRYLPQQAIIEVHPCKVPGAAEACPTTTTTTSTTTTTAPPETTTTTTTTIPETTTTAPPETAPPPTDPAG